MRTATSGRTLIFRRSVFSVQMLFEGIKSRVPIGFESFRPTRHFSKGICLEMVNSLSSFASFRNQISFLQDLKLLRNGGERNAERFRQLTGAFIATYQ